MDRNNKYVQERREMDREHEEVFRQKTGYCVIGTIGSFMVLSLAVLIDHIDTLFLQLLP